MQTEHHEEYVQPPAQQFFSIFKRYANYDVQGAVHVPGITPNITLLRTTSADNVIFVSFLATPSKVRVRQAEWDDVKI